MRDILKSRTSIIYSDHPRLFPPPDRPCAGLLGALEGQTANLVGEVANLPGKAHQELTGEQQLANQALHCRRLRIEHVNSSVKRCRIVKDRIRLWKEGVRDLVMELCCALHNFRVRLTPWQPMV